MQTTIKFILKAIAGILSLLLLFLLAYYFYYKWRQIGNYDDKITVNAFYMQYACGDCSVDMKVEAVDNAKYNFIVGRDIFPTPKTKQFHELCDYIGDKTYNAMSTGRGAFKSFVLIGHLHRGPHGLPIFDCSETPFFTVEKIKYGPDGQWKKF